MKTPCEEVIKEVIPTIRALIAKDLCLKYGFTQIEAAKKLGITQAAISQYISLKRGGKKFGPHVLYPTIPSNKFRPR